MTWKALTQPQKKFIEIVSITVALLCGTYWARTSDLCSVKAAL